eukprot:scaffold2131_cov109-Ochromonas_danica.AAC.1
MLMLMFRKEAEEGNDAIFRELQSLQHKVKGQSSLSMNDLVRLEETLKASNEPLVVEIAKRNEEVVQRKDDDIEVDMLAKMGGDPHHPKALPSDKNYMKTIARPAEEKSSLAVPFSLASPMKEAVSSSKNVASVKRELSSLSHDEAIELVIGLGCSPDLKELCKKSFEQPEIVNGQYLNGVKKLKHLWEIGDTKSTGRTLNKILGELHRIRKKGVPLVVMEEIRRNLLVSMVISSLQHMTESGEVSALDELKALDSIAKIPAEVINRGFTADLSREGWGSKGVTALHIAAAKGHVEMVQLLMLHPAIAVNALDSENGWTPVHYACFHGHVEVVKHLQSDSRVDMNIAAREDGWTPLHVACKNGQEKVVGLLLSNKQVDVTKENKIGYTPFYTACEGDQAEVVKMLLGVERVDINKENELGYTPLHTVCERGHVEVLSTLLTSDRLDVSKVDKVGRTSLHIACKKGHMKIVENLLKDSRVDVNKKEKKDESTPFFIACQQAHVEAVKILLEDDRVDVNMDNKAGYTPLNYVCESVDMKNPGNVILLGILLENDRVEVSRENKEGNTPLHIGCRRGIVEMVKCLLNSGADINKQNKNGHTPLHIACGFRCEEVVKFLLDNSTADVNKEDENGKTALDVAATEEIRRLLREHVQKIRAN